MNWLHQHMTDLITSRGGKVFVFDKGPSMLRVLNQHAQRKLERMRRFGSHRVKVAIRRDVHITPVETLTAIRSKAFLNRSRGKGLRKIQLMSSQAW